MATVTSKGQVTIPKEIREKLGIITGDELDYQSLPSLKEYVMVSQDKKLIEQYVRDGNAWRYVAWFSDSERVELKSVPAVLAFGEVYDGVEVPPGPRG